MLFASHRTNRQTDKNSTTMRPVLESRDRRHAPPNPGFIGATSSIVRDGDLLVTFKETGLVAAQMINYSVTADAIGRYQWYNKSGKTRGQSLPADTRLATGSCNFLTDKTGQVAAKIGCVGSIPPPPRAFLDTSHAATRIAKLTVTYHNIVLTDSTSGVAIPVGDVTATVVVDVSQYL